jgi:hypothetical protein
MTRKTNEAMSELFDADEVESVLRATFYAPERHDGATSPIRKDRPAPPKKARPKPKRAEHYEVICISMYKEDLERLDAKVAELKRAGHRKMSRSALIRFALDTVDVAALPRSY